MTEQPKQDSAPEKPWWNERIAKLIADLENGEQMYIVMRDRASRSEAKLMEYENRITKLVNERNDLADQVKKLERECEQLKIQTQPGIQNYPKRRV